MSSRKQKYSRTFYSWHGFWNEFCLQKRTLRMEPQHSSGRRTCESCTVRVILLAVQQSVLARRPVSPMELRVAGPTAGSPEPWPVPEHQNNSGRTRTGVSVILNSPRQAEEPNWVPETCTLTLPSSVQKELGFRAIHRWFVSTQSSVSG